jgi:hypothetical protein
MDFSATGGLESARGPQWYRSAARQQIFGRAESRELGSAIYTCEVIAKSEQFRLIDAVDTLKVLERVA